MVRHWFLMIGAFMTASPLLAAERIHGHRETLACRLGTEDRHARIAVVLVGGKTTEFAYYSKWKPRTCSIYVQRTHDAFSKWGDTGNMTTINLAEGRGDVLIEHKKGEYRFEFHDVDRERYCGMDGKINGYLVIKKGSSECQLAGVMEEGTPLGKANADREEEPTTPGAGSTTSTAPDQHTSGPTQTEQPEQAEPSQHAAAPAESTHP